LKIEAERFERTEVEIEDVRRRGLQHDLILMMLVQAVGVVAVAAILRATRGLHVGRAPWLGAECAQEGGGVRGAGAHFEVDRLQERAALLAPIVLQAEDGFLKGDHEC